MIIDAYATDTVPSHEVRRRANEALTNAGEPMSEVTYDALRKRLAEAEEEVSIWRSVFPDIAPERVLPDRRLLLDRIAELEAALGHATEYVGRLALTLAGKHYPDQKRFELLPDLLGRIDQIDNMTCGLARAALEGGKDE